MPAVRAYPDVEVIARGLALEAGGAVTATSLHRSLGGRGDPNTAFTTWSAFVAHRGRSGTQGAQAGSDGFSPVVSGQISEIITMLAGLVETSSGERDVIHERRARQLSAMNDTLLARSEELEAEIDTLRAENRRLLGILAARPAGVSKGRLILP